jgi:hypothetical protein
MLLLLCLAACPACAETLPGEDEAIAAEVAASLPPAPALLADVNVQPQPRFWFGRFVDHLDLRHRLSSIRFLKLVPLWDGRRLTIYVGVDRHGMAGLHIQQQDPAYAMRIATMPPAPDAMPPLRAVPLNAL